MQEVAWPCRVIFGKVSTTRISCRCLYSKCLHLISSVTRFSLLLSDSSMSSERKNLVGSSKISLLESSGPLPP